MGTEKQIEQLDARLKVAIVEEVSEGLFDVFVPGALRENTRVGAANEDEAKEKVRDLLISKMEHYASKPVPTGTDQELEIKKAEQVAKAQTSEVNHG